MGETALTMDKSDDIRQAKDIVQTLIKAKKGVRIYPDNNPIYVRTIDDTFARFASYLDYHDEFRLQIRQNSILHDEEEIYYSADKDDNLALFFFKDGLRELSFRRGLTRDETEEFLKIISLDFDHAATDEDIVTLLWQSDFQNIQYVVDEAILSDTDEEDYQARVEQHLKERATDNSDLMKAYTDGIGGDDLPKLTILPLSEKDLHLLEKDIERDSFSKIEKLASILFELVYMSETKADIDETFQFIKDAVHFCLQHGDLAMITRIMRRARDLMEEPFLTAAGKNYFRFLSHFMGQQESVASLAELLDSGIEIEAGIYEEFIGNLDLNAIQPLVLYLGELKTVRARKLVMDALIVLGRKDIQSLARGLDDQRWYLVRNIIYILRMIGDRRSTEHLLRTVRHSDIRVKKEGIKALGELGGHDVVQTLRECLDDAQPEVRMTAAKAFGTIGTDVAKKIILDKIAGKLFRDRDFEEKKVFFEILLRWKDQTVYDFLVNTLRRKAFFGRAKNEESRACAAFCLGLMGKKEAIHELRSAQESGGDFLKDFVQGAIRKLEHEQ